MKKQIKIWLAVACLFVFCFSMICASADIPAGVKDEYQYNKRDGSIVVVKKKLQDLGYFGKNAQLSDFVSEDLKKVVIQFQKQNGMKADGEIDREFLEMLFSEDDIGKNGKKSLKYWRVRIQKANQQKNCRMTDRLLL